MASSRLVIALAFALAACGVGPRRIDVSGPPGDLRFTVVAPEDADRACAQNLTVSPVAPEDADLTWKVSSLGSGKCFDTLRYGKPTADVFQTAPAIPLRLDVAYRVRVSGPGFMVVRDFRVTPRGIAVLN